MLKYFTFIIVALTAIHCSSPVRVNNELEKALGVGIEVSKTIYHNDEAGGFNEGYSIYIVELTDKSIEDFQESLLIENNYPLPTTGWEVFKWEKVPVSDSLEQVKELLVNYYVKDNDRKGYQNEIRRHLDSKDDVYYSFYYKEVANNIVAVQFYLVDIDTKKAFIVKSNL